jgi:hypothetical protein
MNPVTTRAHLWVSALIILAVLGLFAWTAAPGDMGIPEQIRTVVAGTTVERPAP